MGVRRCSCRFATFAIAFSAMLLAQVACGQPAPVFNTVFPAGARVGQTVEVVIAGGHLQTIRSLQSNIPGIECERLDSSRFRLKIPDNTFPGSYDLWAAGENGVSAPRTFVVGNRAEQVELEPNEAADAANQIPLNTVVNGRIEKPGDSDYFRFEAQRGQRVVIECSAERIDSRLRAILEVLDTNGRRLAVNRGYFSSDPLIDFLVPADGSYVVKIQDLISSGGAEHYYRLDVDAGPRVALAHPNVIERGKPARVALYGWNLSTSGQRTDPSKVELDRVDVDISSTQAQTAWPLPVRLQPHQAPLRGQAFAFQFPGGHAPMVLGVSDASVVLDRSDNHSPTSAQEIAAPCEVSGQLAAGDERDWFSIQARRGEVFFVEAFGQRIQSPVDLQISVCDGSGKELAQFTDEQRNLGATFPTSHLDPTGRWVCPSDGRYLLCIRNLTGGLQTDPRRTYWLSVRREEPEFQVVAVPRSNEPIGLNVRRGGREILDVLAFRRRGMDAAIRVTAKDLPPGIECPEIWLGPGVDRTTMVISADRNAPPSLGELTLVAEHREPFTNGERTSNDTASVTHSSPVLSGTIVRSGTPNGWGRLASRFPLAITGDSPVSITADGNETVEHHLYGKLKVRHSPGGVLDVAVHLQRRDTGHQAPVKLIGAGLPDAIQNQTATIPEGQNKGYLSLYLPPTLPVGRYSFVVRAETTVPAANQKTETVVVHSNPVAFDVHPPAFQVEVDPFAVTSAKRGETIRVSYTAQRVNGFIGKMHTELAAPGRITDIVGIRGRGETFTGQTEKGTLQIQINEDAPLGRQSFLRLFTVGVVEDEATYFGSSVLPLEIVQQE